ncbi:hypothetical protein PLACP1_21980 [Planifilum fimeticola]
MREAVIVSAVRTAIARRGGALKDWEPHIYGAEVVKEAIRRARVDPEEIDDVIFGNALAGGGNVARLTALQAGLSLEVPGVTIDRQCGSGMNAVALAALAVQGGAGEIFVAGGTESMTRAPYLLEPPSKPFDRNPPRFVRRLLSPEHIGNPPRDHGGKLGGEIPDYPGGAGSVCARQPAPNGAGDGKGAFPGADRSPDDPRETGGTPPL